ncbi:hypothetical protein G647_10278 [Cladophialophora carrionii CBS 160.54]|uniref:Transcription factor domain-containing protein n=1 Tax=Cladophialophora carrionii CBS 160.54 TaxID=1279043 RepID=V9DLL0_9EURO|nr:uncharacterized protein G647_10278 [Cladophialophora carrionii CBS 160.54]ETI26832.1 hypothetical protein G647_10278 [Cladophialophora carrionii CBS 160.54]
MNPAESQATTSSEGQSPAATESLNGHVTSDLPSICSTDQPKDLRQRSPASPVGQGNPDAEDEKPVDGCCEHRRLPDASVREHDRRENIPERLQRLEAMLNHLADRIALQPQPAPSNGRMGLLWRGGGSSLSVEGLLAMAATRSRKTYAPVTPRALVMAPDVSCLLDLEPTTMHHLAMSYMQNFHPRNMILDWQGSDMRDALQAADKKFERTVDTCILLLVLAIGSISAFEDGFNYWDIPGAGPSGLNPLDEIGDVFFNIATSMFVEARDVSWPSVRCWLLIAFYHSMKLRVYDQWLAVSQAAMTAMMLLRMDERSKRTHAQLYWAIYLQESQLLSEFDFTPTGIAEFESIIPAPPAGGGKPQDETQKQYWDIFLAEILLWRIVNRVRYYVGDAVRFDGTVTGMSPAPFAAPALSMIRGLDHELASWRLHLPLSFRAEFEFDPGAQAMSWRRHRSVREQMIGTLQAGYFKAKAILFRPFLFHILHHGSVEGFSQEESTGAAMGLETALQALLCSGVLCDNLRLVPLLIVPSRSFLALAILAKVLLQSPRCQSLVPPAWEKTLPLIRARLRDQIVARSTVIGQDLETLSLLDADGTA